MVHGSGGLRFSVQGLRSRISICWYKFQGSQFRVQGLGCRIIVRYQNYGSGIRVYGFGFRVENGGLRLEDFALARRLRVQG